MLKAFSLHLREKVGFPSVSSSPLSKNVCEGSSPVLIQTPLQLVQPVRSLQTCLPDELVFLGEGAYASTGVHGPQSVCCASVW